MGQCWVAQQTPACTRMRKPMYTRFGEQVTRLRVLWGAFADLTRHGELWGAFGELLGSFWGAFGSFWGATLHTISLHGITRHYTEQGGSILEAHAEKKSLTLRGKSCITRHYTVITRTMFLKSLHAITRAPFSQKHAFLTDLCLLNVYFGSFGRALGILRCLRGHYTVITRALHGHYTSSPPQITQPT